MSLLRQKIERFGESVILDEGYKNEGDGQRVISLLGIQMMQVSYIITIDIENIETSQEDVVLLK